MARRSSRSAPGLPLRSGLDRPTYQFTPPDVNSGTRIAFVVAIAAQLAVLTGLMSAERGARIEAGRNQIGAEQASRPKVVGNTVVASAFRIHGGILAPGVPPR